VADAECATGERVQCREVRAAVVGEDALDLDAVAAVEGDRAVQERDRGCCFLVSEDLGVGEAAVVVDADVDELPADRAAVAAGGVSAARPVAARRASTNAFAGAARDPAELFDVDVDELAGSRALIPDRLLEAEPAKSAHPQPLQDPGNGRERHPQRLGDLGGGESQPTQLDNRLDAVSAGAVGDPLGRRGTIEQTLLTF